jgi:ribonucleoside-triphosphate reductase
MPKPHRKLIAFNKIFHEMQKAYGFKAANEWIEREWKGELYLHDADTSTFKSYCFAYDLKELAERGLFFLGDNFNPKPPKHLTTFIDFVKEYINFASNRTSGAVGLPNLIPYMYYFWYMDHKEGYMAIADWDKYARQNLQRFIYAVNQPCVRDGQQSAFTNTSVFDREYLMALFGGSKFPNGEPMVKHIEEIMNFQKLYMEVMAEIREENMFTFPVSTISLIRKNKEFADKDFAEWAIKHNMRWSDSNFFIDDNVSSLSNCCRLKSDIKDLGYFNSIGSTALKVGSIKVNTINLARLALDTENTEEYLEELHDRTICCLKVLHVVRHIIKRNVEKGLLPNFSHGLIDFQSCYSTIGFIGIYESLKKFGFVRHDEFGNAYYTDEGVEFGKEIFETINNAKAEFIEEYQIDYMINCEQIPGENAASKLMRKDKFFYPDSHIYELPLYGNQFMPLGIKATLQERIRVQALFDKFCNGGSILHVNIDAPFANYGAANKMVEYIADSGVTYFAFNTKIQACEDNHAFYGTTCPICGKPIATEYTRVVGFLVPVSSWTKERKAEYKLRKWEKTTGESIKSNE